MHSLTIGTSTIRQLDGLYSLNDLHQAAGSEPKHQPAKFMRLDQTQALVMEISNSPDVANYASAKSADMQICTKTVRGGKGGTYVCRELVYAYAMWISPKFHLQVIRAFDAMQAQPAKPSLPDPQALPPARYHYPESLLKQPYFISPLSGRCSLNLSMLSDTTHYVSPLMALLNQLRSDGHDVSAPFEEAVAMRSVLQQVDADIDAMAALAVKARYRQGGSA